MDTKQIAEIRKALGESLTEDLASTLNEVESIVKDASKNTSKIEDLQAQLEQAQSEKAIAERDMMKYKSIQKKATEQISEIETELEGFKSKMTELESLKKENESLKTLKVEKDNQLRSSYNEKIEALKELPVFEKIKEKIVLPTEEAPLDKLEIDQIESSLSKINEWEEVGAFQSKDSRGVSDKTDAKEAKPDFIKGFDGAWGRK